MTIYRFVSSYSSDGKLTASYNCTKDGDDAAYKVIGRFKKTKDADEACIDRARKIKRILQNTKGSLPVTFIFDLRATNNKNVEAEFNTP